MKKGNMILKKIRTDRGLSLSDFSCLVGISTSYVCMLEKDGENGRVITKEIVNKVITNIPDISPSEKCELEIAAKEDNLISDGKMQKHIMKLITEFFYRLKNGLDGLDKLGEEIISFIKELKEKDRTDEMAMFMEA